MAKIPTPVSLSQLVKDTADQLRQIRTEVPRDPVIEFQGCEIELAVGISVEPGGKVKLVVFEFGADASYENTQKIVLKFGPVPGVLIQAPAIGEGEAPLPDA